ncbi:OmpA family protein [Ferruginibacter albus]|uniref:OmpA family protein n=1 Tax=Ferruginibacter albus TaxID=2875540 RepID=UPI001CC35057|nr:carboxypeptidase regulatory-like domain-containing protein [Ferruginibacter albus]UAY53499.1 hypothetical protein K9M53_07440 [Ferruginibacter albus]
MKSKIFFTLAILFTICRTTASPVIHAHYLLLKKVSSHQSIILSGNVKDEAGQALQNVTILFDTTVMTVTDAAGNYSFELAEVTPAAHRIYFQSEGYVTVVRSYYPAAGSTTYNIVLRGQFGKTTQAVIKPVTNNNLALPVVKDTLKRVSVVTQPIKSIAQPIKKDSIKISTPKENIIKPANKPTVVAVPQNNNSQQVETTNSAAIINKDAISTAPLDFPTILFKPNMTALNALSKAFLDRTAQLLIQNPDVNVDIKAYALESKVNSSLVETRLNNVINYLIQKGISVSRLNKIVVANGGDENIIDIITSKQ